VLKLLKKEYIFIEMTVMKKIIIADSIRKLIDEEGLFGRSSIRILEVSSNTAVLDIHSDEKTDLIITDLEMPGMSVEKLCSEIRNDKELRNVSIIIVCPDSESEKRILQAKANAVISKPVNAEMLIDKARHLLNIAKRTSFRVPIAVKVEGRHMDKPFLGHSEDLSASGMMFYSDKTIGKGERIVCAFMLDDVTRIATDAEVVRVERRQVGYDTKQYGIRFVDADKEFISAIEAFIEKKRGEAGY
jgi:CheY-like chemotaxis protein